MRYFWATIRHKWFVFLASFKVGLPFWRALVHDLSKFTWAELPLYNRQFFGDKSDPAGFARAWLHHYHCNDHHWEHWIVESIHSHTKDRDGCIIDNCLAMPVVCVQEMIADWLGASKAYTGSWVMTDWLQKNLMRIKVHPGTMESIVKALSFLGYRALSGKQTEYNKLWNYYDGDQPLTYTAERLQTLFRDVNARFTENWCAVVVDSVLDRLNLGRFQVTDNEAATDTLNALWLRTEMGLDSDDAHLASLVTGEAFVIVWLEDGTDLQVYYNDPRLCHVQYDPENPRIALWAAKWWQVADKSWRMTLYYPDHLEDYATKDERVSDYKEFRPMGEPEAPNPFGVIPVFHLRLNRRIIKGELNLSILDLQDAVNKLLADMMVAAEFGAFQQRYVISQLDPGDLRNAPNELWLLPAGDGVGQTTTVGQFSATNLDNFGKQIDKLSTAIGIISRTPRHYFYAQGGDPSGEALIAMESPLNKKVQRHIERFTVTWQQVATFMLSLQGLQVDPMSVTPIFDPVQTVQPRTEADIREINVRSGIPLTTTLRREGWTDAELEQMQEDQAAEQLAQADLARAYLGEARRQFDQESQEQGT
jgi:hypothetical protein